MCAFRGHCPGCLLANPGRASGDKYGFARKIVPSQNFVRCCFCSKLSHHLLSNFVFWYAGIMRMNGLDSQVMKTMIIAAIAALSAFSGQSSAQEVEEPKWSIAIHGGAGTIAPESMTEEQRAEYEAALQNALDAGASVLANGGSAMDAVKAAIVPLEDSPLFNAGRGAVFTWEGRNELDASIMDGTDRSAGAVTGVTTIKNPILLADKVRTDSPHVFLMGDGAEQFASEQDLETAPPEWFATQHRRDALERMKADRLSSLDVDHKFGTVGAVALDQNGNLAAGTSTGGMTGKRWGRIGDSPVIGAGTYADNRSCAVSATGWGEYFIRVGVAHEICTRIRLHGGAAQEKADAVMAEVAELGGDGGIILVTPDGEALFSFNTSGMYRGRATSQGVNEVAIFGDE
jgi:beta-aspartyl-peptidase (threonine type)